jgi:UDP-N-acetylmuramoyl-tripeptide--D-alanyl-D-alanine ligase
LSFILVDQRSGERQPCNVRLLGRHNVSNILFASAIAQELGMTLAAIARRAATLAPVEHRLQLLERANGVTVIDDAYNSNPVGARIALETLASFEGGRKILITPGMVELGPLEQQANEALGRQAAGVCDFVILVGPNHTAPIRSGLLACGFPAERLFVATNLQEALGMLDRTVAAKDTVLFLNDLPDLYSEIA